MPDFTTKGLGFQMYARQADANGYDESTYLHEWVTDEGVREFWYEEAAFVIYTLDELGAFVCECE